ncbi:MAG TPA: hypothetical protein DIW30_03595 [Bacteroidales bacterium]|nr:hypothetical protein [Bacteroidales bacterium]
MIANHCRSEIQSINLPGGGLFSYTPHFCLIPETLYREEDQDLWLNFLEEHISRNQVIGVCHIEEDHCFLLHEKESDKHEEHCLSVLMKKSHTLEQANKIVALVAEKTMCAVLYKNHILQLANMFAVDSTEDILYYLMNLCEQLFTECQVPIYIANQDLASDRKLTTYLNIHYLSLG